MAGALLGVVQYVIDEQKFFRKVQRFLESISVIGPHTPALLVAFSELAGEQGDDSNEPLRISTDAIAPKLIEYYWSENDPSSIVLPHILAVRKAAVQTEIAQHINAERKRYSGSLVASLMDQDGWRVLVRDISVMAQRPLYDLYRADQRRGSFFFEKGLAAEDNQTTHVVLRAGIPLAFRRCRITVEDAVAWIA
jgi:hypothetical protein